MWFAIHLYLALSIVATVVFVAACVVGGRSDEQETESRYAGTAKGNRQANTHIKMS